MKATELIIRAIKDLPMEFADDETRWVVLTESSVVFVNPRLEPMMYKDGKFEKMGSYYEKINA